MILLLMPSIFFSGCTFSFDNNRFQIVQGNKKTLMIDSRTGNLWVIEKISMSPKDERIIALPVKTFDNEVEFITTYSPERWSVSDDK